MIGGKKIDYSVWRSMILSSKFNQLVHQDQGYPTNRFFIVINVGDLQGLTQTQITRDPAGIPDFEIRDPARRSGIPPDLLYRNNQNENSTNIYVFLLDHCDTYHFKHLKNSVAE